MEGKFGAINVDENAIDKFNLSIEGDVPEGDEIMEAAIKRRVQNPISNTKLENIPQHLMHHIMDFLPTDDATKISVLSRAFYASWLSFPVLDLDFAWFSRHLNSQRFVSFIDRTLELRGPHLVGSLQKLRFSYKIDMITNNYRFQPVLERLMNFAVEKQCKELDLEISIILPAPTYFELLTYFLDVSYITIQQVFTSEFLTVLKLKGFNIPVEDLVIRSSSLKVLSILSCNGITTVNVSCPTLEEVEVKFCLGMKGIRVETDNLDSFKFIGEWSNGIEPGEVDLSACQSVKILSLESAKVSDWLLKLATEFLHVKHCLMKKNLTIHNANIRTLEFINCHEVENLVVFAKNLESFDYRSSSEQKIEIDISACDGITNLVLKGATLTDKWIRKNISGLRFLESLIISYCNRLERVEFRNEELNMFILKCCTKLKEVEIDARNLLDFTFSGSLDISPMVVLSSKCSATIILQQRRSNDWHEKLRKMLCNFDHFQVLTIVCTSGQDFIFPSEFLCTKLSPLYDVKHLTLQVRDLPEYGRALILLVQSLLWLVPNPDTLTLSCGRKKNTLKFEYSKKAEREVEEKCCSTVPIKCWRHYAVKIEIEGFEGKDRENMEKFFAPYNIE